MKLHYETQGSGHPLILLHGNGENLHIFDSLINKLKNDFLIYAIDSRNHGLSPKSDDNSYESMAQDIIEFVEEKQLKNPYILGFSDGAIIALMINLKKSIFSKMILLGVNLSPDDFTLESIEYLKSEYEKTKDPLLKLMLEEPNIDLESLKNIQTPTLIVYAEFDIFNESIYLKINEKIQNSKILKIMKHDHSSYIDNNDLLYLDVKNFLKDVK